MIWTDIEDSLPYEHEDVLLCLSKPIPTIESGIIIGHRNLGMFFDIDGAVLTSVTHWMPLPKRP